MLYYLCYQLGIFYQYSKMKEFYTKRKVKRILYSKFSILLLVGIFFLIAKAGFHLYEKERESASNLRNAKQELGRLKDRQGVLTDEIRRLSTPIGVEQEIREKFKVAKEGEHMIIIVGDEEKIEPPQEDVSFYKRIQMKLGGFFK